jgi:hypothetical protein
MRTDSTSRTLPLPAPIEALLASERVIVPQPEIVCARALARARAAIRTDCETAMPLPRVTSTRPRRLVLAAAAGIAFIAGAAAAFQMMRQPVPTTNEAARTIGRPTPGAPPLATPVPAPSVVVQAAPARTVGTVASASPKPGVTIRRTVAGTENDVGLAELRLLDRARQSDARGDYGSVLAVVAEHEHGFPTGRLSEEREALRVKALVGLGHGNEAHHAGARFHRQFPRSVLLAKIDDMLASLP